MSDIAATTERETGEAPPRRSPFSTRYDLVVVGTGPAGQEAAIEAARNGKRVAAVERQHVVGGVCLHTGTMPSKALREAVLSLLGGEASALRQLQRRMLRHPSIVEALRREVGRVISRELAVIERRLRRFGVDVLFGEARFVGEREIAVRGRNDKRMLEADWFVLANGTRPRRPAGIPYGERKVIDTDEFLDLESFPQSAAILGGGAVAAEYASVLSLLGMRIDVISPRGSLLGFLDNEPRRSILRIMSRNGVTIHQPSRDPEVSIGESGEVRIDLGTGRVLETELLITAVGRVGAAASLNPRAAGLEIDGEGWIPIDGRLRTNLEHVYAAGDVAGPPATVSTAKLRGRRASREIFGLPIETDGGPLLPYVVFTVPQTAYVGRRESDLLRGKVPFIAGRAAYREVAKGEIIDDETGSIKLLFHAVDHRLLGAHLLGSQASELVHIAQMAIRLRGTLEYFTEEAFAYPSLSECYRLAAFDAIERERGR